MAAVLAAAAVVMVVPGTASSAVSCTTVTTSKGTLTAAQVGGDVTGTLDATGCDIAVYYDAGETGNVSGADVFGATQYGVFVDGINGDASANVTDSSIHDVGQVGVYYYGVGTAGTASGTVDGNTVSDYFKAGIVVNGADAGAAVVGNTVSGSGPLGSVAQNGIQFGYGGSGQARGNTVDGNWYTGANWTSTGILVFESDNVIVDRNTVSGNQTGLDAESWCFYGVPSASNNKFVANTVTNADWGITVAAYSYSSDCDAMADNNKVTNNTLTGSGNADSEGVFVGAYSYDGVYTPEAVNNKVINNSISGFETATDTGYGSATKVHANAVG